MQGAVPGTDVAAAAADVLDVRGLRRQERRRELAHLLHCHLSVKLSEVALVYP